MVKDSVAAHAREELGISDISATTLIMAALTSAEEFTARAAAPLFLILMILTAPSNMRIQAIASGLLLFLVFLGLIDARIGDAKLVKPTIRVRF